jgi:putative transposase
MPRVARVVGSGYPHHVVQRGNNREKVFLDREDYEKYRSLIERYSIDKEVRILAYCLMQNHAHMLVRPSGEQALFKMMQGIALCYTQYFNTKRKRTGRLWECRYYSAIVDEERYLWAVCRYIERNPVRAGMVEKPTAYRYSSARAHLLGETDPLLGESLFDRSELGEYRRFLTGEDEQVLQEIRKQTRAGRPLGDEDFLASLSERLSRSLSFRSRGRPRKEVQRIQG